VTAVDVRHCDWRDPDRGLVALGPVDHLFADPAFDPHVHAMARTNSGGLASKVDLEFAPITEDERHALCLAAAATVRRFVIVHSDFESVGRWRDAMEANGIEYLRTGVWLKIGAMPQMSGDRPAASAEAIVIGHATRNGKPIRKRWNGGGGFAEYRYPVPHRKGRHKTEKPVPLLERLVDDFTDHGELIADTHLGSGTSLVAAIRRGRRGVGWERQERWALVAAKRAAAAREQFSWVDQAQERARAEQASLFNGGD
jgi:DNA methylase